MINSREMTFSVDINSVFARMSVSGSSITFDSRPTDVASELIEGFVNKDINQVSKYFTFTGNDESARNTHRGHVERYITSPSFDINRILLRMRELPIPGKNIRIFFYEINGDLGDYFKGCNYVMVTGKNVVLTSSKNSTVHNLWEAVLTEGYFTMALLNRMSVEDRIKTIGATAKKKFDYNIDCLSMADVGSGQFITSLTALSIMNHIIGVSTNEFIMNLSIDGDIPITSEFKKRYIARHGNFNLPVDKIMEILDSYDEYF